MSDRFEYMNGVIFDNNSKKDSYSEYNLNNDNDRKALCDFLNKREDNIRELEIEKLKIGTDLDFKEEVIRQLQRKINSCHEVMVKFNELVAELIDYEG